MKLISTAHQDSLYPDVNDLDHPRCQVILFHVLFEEGKLLGNIKINFLSCLFQILSTYQSIKKIEDINIEMNHIQQLNESLNVEQMIIAIFLFFF